MPVNTPRLKIEKVEESGPRHTYRVTVRGLNETVARQRAEQAVKVREFMPLASVSTESVNRVVEHKRRLPTQRKWVVRVTAKV